MNKKFVLLTAILLVGAIGTYAASVDKLQPVNGKNNKKAAVKSEKAEVTLDKDTVFYPNASMKSAISKYKAGNYTGCLQELFSLTKKDPSNAVAYYYMAMAYTHVDMQAEAVEAYEKVLALSPNEYLVQYATKGKDCLTGGPACNPEPADEQDELDQFVNAPYGNGMSPSLNNEVRQKELTNIQQTINKKDELELQDIQKIREFDQKKNKSSIEKNDKIAQVSDEELLKAIKTLRDAGLTVNIQSENQYAQMYQDPQMAELSMMLGGNNNSMMNIVPMLMAQNQNGKNIDPRLMQAVMMNSMMEGFNSYNDNNNRY